MSDDPHHFEFNLDLGIREQVVAKLEASPALPLTKLVGPQKSGVYALYHKGDLVYIGKASKETTKSGRTLRMRLGEHVGKLNSRDNISIEDITCRFLTFESEWWVFASEFALIRYYEPTWNGSGYGSKIPGRGRPGTTERVSRFDAMYPLKASREARSATDIDDAV